MTLYHKTEDCQRVLAHATGNIILLQPQDKRPVHNDWVTGPTNINGDGRAYFDLGYNLGFRIPQDHLIVDVDPRNGGLESYAMLPQEVQDLPVTTITASGGFHVYTMLPDGCDCKTLRSAIKELPGIDFLHYGKQVVLPGSMINEMAGWRLHPNSIFPPPEAPVELLQLLNRPVSEPKIVDLDAYLSVMELDQILSMIPVERYQDNDTWLKMAMACHHATDGEGLPAFLAWSTNDPMYADQGEIIARRWESMNSGNTPAPVTIRSLIKELSNYAPVPSWLLARANMKTSPEEFFGVLEERQEQTSDAFDALAAQIDAEGNHVTLLTKMAVKIGMESTITESMKEILIKKIAVKTGTSITSIRKDIKLMIAPKYQSVDGETPADAPTDEGGMEQPHTMAAQTAISAIASGGVPPAYCYGRWLKWNGQCWGDAGTEVEIRREAHKALYNQGTHATDTAIRSVVGIMQTMMEVPVEAFKVKVDEIIVHTALHTLKLIDKKWNVSTPSAGNRNLTYIGALYEPKAPEPTAWFKFLDDVTTSPEARRTIACAIIYAAAECRPWLRKAVYLYGPKRSGKSTMLNLIQDILGQGNCSALNMRQIGSKHGGFNLVGKLANISNETVSKDTIQDDVFKALISGETIEVEPKFKAPMLLQNTAKLFFGANGFPRVSDESDATWDRLTIISCPVSISATKCDPLLGTELKAEMSGILNWALQIFEEEYQKDTCVSAMSMDSNAMDIMMSWKELNNPAIRWIKERTIKILGSAISIGDAYQDYRTWCRDNGHKELNKIHFSRQIGQTLERTKREGMSFVVGVSLAPVVSTHFSSLD